MIGRYVLGVVALAVICGGLGIAAVALRRRWLPTADRAVALLATAVIGLTLLVTMSEVLGTLGLFALAPIVVASILIGMAVGGPPIARIRAQRACDRNAARRLDAIAVITLAAAAAVMAEWAGPTQVSYDIGIRTFDSLWYHLPWAASFAHTGQITGLRFTDVEYLTPFYPATAEMLHGLGIVLLGHDTLSPAFNLVCLALVLLAAYCIGRPRGAGAATLLGGAIAMATPMMSFSQAGSAANDVVGIFFLLAAVALLLNVGESRAGLALAAVAAGLAVGVKLSLLGPVLALSFGVLVVYRPRWLWAVGVFLAGGFWYVRNLIAVGNPLPWLNLPGLATPAPALQQHTGFSVLHYVFNSRIISHAFVPGLHAGLGSWWPVVLLSAVVGPLLCLLPGAEGTVRMLGLVALAALVAYVVTPESAAGPSGDPLGFAFNLRYSAPALALALVATPLAPPLVRDRRAARATVGVLALVLIATLAQGRLWPSGYVAGAITIGLAAAVIAATPLFVPRMPRLAALAGVAVLLLGGVAAGYALQRHYLRGRYRVVAGVSHLSGVWALFRHIQDARVGIVGTFGGFFSYPLFGPDGSNTVQYVAARGPHGSFTSIRTCRRWREAVNAGRYRYLVTTPARDPWHPSQLGFSPERAWTASDRAARVIYDANAFGQPITVFAVRRSLDPVGCG